MATFHYGSGIQGDPAAIVSLILTCVVGSGVVSAVLGSVAAVVWGIVVSGNVVVIGSGSEVVWTTGVSGDAVVGGGLVVISGVV